MTSEIGGTDIEQKLLLLLLLPLHSIIEKEHYMVNGLIRHISKGFY